MLLFVARDSKECLSQEEKGKVTHPKQKKKPVQLIAVNILLLVAFPVYSAAFLLSSWVKPLSSGGQPLLMEFEE